MTAEIIFTAWRAVAEEQEINRPGAAGLPETGVIADFYR